MPLEKKINTQTDGRAQRTLRSRSNIIEAVMSLYADGVLVPTAQEVADRSGLGIRTVFRHFSEMEALFIAGNELLYKRYEQEPMQPPEGDLSNRIEQLVSIRMKIYNEYSPYIRATLVQKWRYPILDKTYRTFSQRLKQQVVYFLPEAKQLRDPIFELLVIALSYESWDKMRTMDKRSKKAITGFVHDSVNFIISSRAIS
ncbi:MAG: AcrR family transcriptional regulator [Arenicella sp.]|jgi:AcrR family transcriptional regulator